MPVDHREEDFKLCQLVPTLSHAPGMSIGGIHVPSTLQVCTVDNDGLHPMSGTITVFESTAVVSRVSFASGRSSHSSETVGML
jgi:hypothetical protein